MTGAQMDAALDAIGWTRRQLAGRVGHRNRTQVDRWAHGVAAIPPELAGWLSATATWHLDNPPPQLQTRNYPRV